VITQDKNHIPWNKYHIPPLRKPRGNRQTSGESASLQQYLGCNTVCDVRLRVTFLRRKTVPVTSIKHCAPRISSKMATIDEFALKNIGLWWRYGIRRHCDERKYIIIGRIFESEIILIPPSLKISESSSNGSYRNTDRRGMMKVRNQPKLRRVNLAGFTARVIVLWQENVRGTRNASLASDRYNVVVDVVFKFLRQRSNGLKICLSAVFYMYVFSWFHSV
jgi:hypothetical protein